MEKLEVRLVIKYVCQKGMPRKEIHEYFMETFGNEYLSYSTMKIWTAEFKRERESGMIKTFSTRYASVRFIEYKIFVSQLFDLIEGIASVKII